MAGRGGSARAARRSGNFAAGVALYDDFEEPDTAPESHSGSKTTGLSLSDLPDDDALQAIEDPERMRRQQNRGLSRVQRRTPRSIVENQNDESSSTRGSSEKLFSKLKRKLVTPPNGAYSDIRETPIKGSEDYRHDRLIAEESKRRRARRAASAQFTAPASPRSRPSSRQAQENNASNKHYAEHTLENKNKKLKVEKDATMTEQDSQQDSPVKNTDAPENLPEDVQEGVDVEPNAKITSPKKDLVNNDFCNSCGGTGELLCCETCVRSFHFSCIEPPVMDVEEIKEEEWSCRCCKPAALTEIEQKEVAGNSFEPSISASTAHNAVAFQSPANSREMFTHIESTKYGEYLDEAGKTPSAPPVHRIQDKDGRFSLCFKCKGNGLKDRHLAVCSICQEPWHIDCLDPPLESTPFGYWVCPLHAGRGVDIPIRVKNPQISLVQSTRHIKNNGDIEIEDSDDEEKHRLTTEEKLESSTDNDRINVTEEFEDEDVAKNIHFPAQTRVIQDGSIVAKIVRHRPRGYEQDRVVHKLPSRTIKLDFLDAINKVRAKPFKETPTADFMFGSNILANKPQEECEAIRNSMLSRVSGPTVSAAQAKDNLETLVTAALDDDNEIGQIVAIRKLMKEKGKERLLEILQSI